MKRKITCMSDLIDGQDDEAVRIAISNMGLESLHSGGSATDMFWSVWNAIAGDVGGDDAGEAYLCPEIEMWIDILEKERKEGCNS
jgi:hypothetical protein